MCGISGIFHLDLQPVNTRNLEAMTSAIRHRGPDDEGYLTLNTLSGKYYNCYGDDTAQELKSSMLPLSERPGQNLGFGFRRLSILDLTVNGHQPMCSEDGSVWIVYNGEIYNYVELRTELRKLGYVFKSNTDTEVIIKCYLQWGIDCLKLFNGMWAFAIWDNRNKRLFCSRDRFGIKPFYYYFENDTFIFGSEVKQFLKNPISKEIDLPVIHKSMSIGGFTINSNNTYFKHIKILQHSHYILIENNIFKLIRYYDLDHTTFEKSRLNFNEACESYQGVFKNAVKICLRSDVALGTTLSGGLDSSAITAVAAEYSHKQLQTFSSFYTYAPQYDERERINLVVEKTRSKAHYITATPQEVWDEMQQIIWYHDYPLESSSPVAQYFVMKSAGKNGVTTLLSGQGSDEITGGYNHAFYRYYADLLGSLRLLKFLAEYPGYLRNNAKGNYFSKICKTLASLLMNEKYIYSLDYVLAFNPVLKPQLSNTMIDEMKSFNLSRLSNFLYNQVMTNTLQTLLHFEDRNSMAHSRESRVPFLDYRLVELAATLPSDYKIHGYYGKYIHREAIKKFVPNEITCCKNKNGFLSPGEQIWLRNELKPYADEIMSSPDFNNRGIYNYRVIKKAYLEYIKGNNRYAKKIWHMLMLELWFRVFID